MARPAKRGKSTKQLAKKAPKRRKLAGVSQLELANAIGVTVRQAQRYTDAGMPRHPDGSYPLALCVQWWRDEQVRIERAKLEPSSRNEIDKRIAMADARMKELKLAQMEGVLIPLEMHEHRLGVLLDQLRAKVMVMPAKHAHLIEGLEDRVAAEEALRLIGTELLGALIETASELDVPAAESADEVIGDSAAA